MTRRLLALAAWVLVLPILGIGQDSAAIDARFEQHKGDFDYLLGDWQFTADSKDYGKYGG